MRVDSSFDPRDSTLGNTVFGREPWVDMRVDGLIDPRCDPRFTGFSDCTSRMPWVAGRVDTEGR